MEEIKVNEYVRTWDGIKKIVKINEGKDITNYGKYIVEPQYKNSSSISVNNILKHSPNIIDLIEERRLCKWRKSRKNSRTFISKLPEKIDIL